MKLARPLAAATGAFVGVTVKTGVCASSEVSGTEPKPSSRLSMVVSFFTLSRRHAPERPMNIARAPSLIFYRHATRRPEQKPTPFERCKEAIQFPFRLPGLERYRPAWVIVTVVGLPPAPLAMIVT
ncbi:MAG: hypothetical protein ACOYMS_04430 [Terrimicrobiaceae bacterium]